MSHYVDFLKSVLRHIRSGQGFLSKDNILARLEICKGCPHFRKQQSCTLCGCGCGNSKSFLNKLAYPDEKCPDTPSRWGKENEISQS